MHDVLSLCLYDVIFLILLINLINQSYTDIYPDLSGKA